MRKLTPPANSTASTEATTSWKVVGKSKHHESAIKQTRGDALFIDDIVLPAGALHAAVVVSDVAKGVIQSIDLSAVEQHPDVVKVLTAADIPGKSDIGPIFEGDPLLADGQIKYHSQPIALVLATSHRSAWQAAKLASITLMDQPASVAFDSAEREPHILPARQFITPNHIETSSEGHSDTSSADDVIINSSLSIGGQEHFYLEGQISLAMPSEDRGIFVRSSSQHPTEVQTLVAEVLGIPFNQVTVDMRRMGGGFGGKESQAAQWACLASLGVHHTGKAVKMRLPRGMDMSMTGKRHPFHNHYQLSASSEGVINSASITVNGLCGHSADLSGAIVDRAMFHADNAYYLNKATITGNRLATDTVSHTAFRGFGGPQGMITIEAAMQHLAIATGKDALDIRLANLYRDDKNITPYGQEVEQTNEMKAIIEQLEQSAIYRKRRLAIQQWNKTNPVLKKGLALTPVKFGISFTATHLNQAGALVHVYTDGSVQVSHGGTEMGQGLHTKVGQIVAQTLGIDYQHILVTSTRTDKVPNTSPTAASSGADLNGMAAHNAAKTIKERLINFAQQHYKLSEPIEIVADELVSGEFRLSWHKLVQEAYFARVSLSSNGFYKTPKIWFDMEKSVGRPFFYFSLGASCSEVTIDTLTGEMQVDRVDIVHDVGNSLNPALDYGQIEGAFIQGMGWLTTEDLRWDDSGKLASNSPMNYKIPTIGDYPAQLNISLSEHANPEHSIYRSKAVGEPPFMHAISVWCAVYDAIGSISDHTIAPKLQAPATGEQILQQCMAQYEQIGYTRAEVKSTDSRAKEWV
ncbi:xanthine dehydrogenase molybdopterin binding subunit [Vibrio ulleungensis]|uniref:Xanthine dehydrogenase molybdopterin binding subunit n=1 Tax=Vibrio ulleungensis TaxID=2807619 RepID=A0ABS2HHU7_9VIBR|nr:xanthine dehydrogenase molybdopterin binding subunit [Vibrio ulleungensis]MBM7036037.1 xanthine dehydrogenase molybdopterin binding subunit [Vibrio ulleungensis]